MPFVAKFVLEGHMTSHCLLPVHLVLAYILDGFLLWTPDGSGLVVRLSPHVSSSLWMFVAINLSSLSLVLVLSSYHFFSLLAQYRDSRRFYQRSQ
ncbi:hypothetical protein VN97_g3078 [Penicillium thymicola]|uniref:Uncharacterized protein n=1 Tax=Penicillium thymicola TaxID=293382 RepID=A0AAI9TMW2_PENTH|nr:hypothetical protein VN97_g3078 [Penicillium thymicola]